MSDTSVETDPSPQGGVAPPARRPADPLAAMNARPAVGDGGPDMVQILTPEGQRLSNGTYDPILESLTDDELRGFYRDLVLIRRVDAEATALQRQGELGIWASLLGQEAAQVGSGRAMRPQDYAFPSYREHGVAWCRVGRDRKSVV